MGLDSDDSATLGRKRAGAELNEILQTFEELLGQELDYDELTELMRAADRE